MIISQMGHIARALQWPMQPIGEPYKILSSIIPDYAGDKESQKRLEWNIVTRDTMEYTMHNVQTIEKMRATMAAQNDAGHNPSLAEDVPPWDPAGTLQQEYDYMSVPWKSTH